MNVTVFDGGNAPYVLNLNAAGRDSIVFGRRPDNDLVLDSPLVSGHPCHGRFVRVNGRWVIEDLNSTNGLIFNNAYIHSRVLQDGDLIRIDSRKKSLESGVLFLVIASGQQEWRRVPLKSEITVGRAAGNDIILREVNVSRHHARIYRSAEGWMLEDLQSTNGVVLNNRQLRGRTPLREKDVIVIAGTRLIFTTSGVYYAYGTGGISLDVSDVVIRRGQNITGNHISVSIRPGELVAIIGGSGAGKSTLLNCMCGYLEPSEGNVYLNGVDLYRNFETMKKTFGYVPQSDIVYDNLTLWDMLLYTAKLRLPKDTTDAEREAAIMRAIRTVDLEDRKDHLIRKLSGGQRKRASIAVELLSDPRLLFLDEPASGLDPGTERSLMRSLRAMADAGKTIVLVTHSTLQLGLCDRIIFMGKGGNLCFYGSSREALNFFGVKDIVDVYEPMTNDAPRLRDRYNRMAAQVRVPQPQETAAEQKKPAPRQISALCSRYIRLIVNDRQRFILLMAQAPLLGVLIALVADGEQFNQYEMTKSLLFALSCSAFWIGMLNAIQEICKERSILKREYMTGLSLTKYLLSKILVLGLMCLVQSLMITSVFTMTVGAPEEGVMMGAFAELLLVTFLTALSSSAMGLFVSSLFSNADRAMTVAPLLLMPQILFSGLLFVLKGATKAISWFAVCRWSMEGFGTTANLNDLPRKLEQEGIMLPREAEDFFTFTDQHFLTDCAILLLFTVGFLVLARVVLNRLKKDGA